MAQKKFGLTPDQAAFVSEHLPNCDLKEKLEQFSLRYTIDLNVKIYRFLESNELSIAWIPKIEDLGRYPGGYALVKEISQAGGLKKVRPHYAHYLFSKLSN